MVKLSLHCLGLRRTRHLLAAVLLPFFTWRCASPDPAEVAAMTSSAAALLPWECTCLPRALVTSHLLARMGIPCELRLGVAKKADGTPEAHAWVEHEGRVLDPTPEETRRFCDFGSLPPQRFRSPYKPSI